MRCTLASASRSRPQHACPLGIPTSLNEGIWKSGLFPGAVLLLLLPAAPPLQRSTRRIQNLRALPCQNCASLQLNPHPSFLCPTPSVTKEKSAILCSG